MGGRQFADDNVRAIELLDESVMFVPRGSDRSCGSHLPFIVAPLACHKRTGLGLPLSAELTRLRQHAVRLHTRTRRDGEMMRKTVLMGTALAVAIAFSPAQAASPFGPGAQPAAENLVHSVKTKRKGKISKMMHKMAEKMKGHRRHARYTHKHLAMSHGGCRGAYMFRKGGKCMDARNK
jgi:hypothetical protein